MKIQCACAGWPRVGIGVVLAGLLSMVNISPSFAQLAKIQRKTAQLTVHPPISPMSLKLTATIDSCLLQYDRPLPSMRRIATNGHYFKCAPCICKGICYVFYRNALYL